MPTVTPIHPKDPLQRNRNKKFTRRPNAKIKAITAATTGRGSKFGLVFLCVYARFPAPARACVVVVFDATMHCPLGR